MEDPASLQFDGCLAAQVLYSAVPAASPLNDAWRIRYHPEWVQEREVTLAEKQNDALPSILDSLEDAVCTALLASAAREALEERLDTMAAVALDLLFAEELDAPAAGLAELQLVDHRDFVEGAAVDLVLESLLQDMCEEVTALVWDEETPRDSFVLLDPGDYARQPRTKPSRLHSGDSRSTLPTQVFSRQLQQQRTTTTTLLQTGYRQETVTFSRETHSRSYMMPPSVTRNFSIT